MQQQRQWYVLCSPDHYCVILPQQAYPGHRLLAGPFATDKLADAWRQQHCTRYQPDGGGAPDWLCQ